MIELVNFKWWSTYNSSRIASTLLIINTELKVLTYNYANSLYFYVVY